jgi:hypothetical protein
MTATEKLKAQIEVKILNLEFLNKNKKQKSQ